MTRPACDGEYATFIGASVEEENWKEEISNYLNNYPGSNYLRTDVSCSSLRQRTETGQVIYAVFFGPFGTFQEACDAVALGPAGSYAKPLDNFSDPNEVPEC